MAVNESQNTPMDSEPSKAQQPGGDSANLARETEGQPHDTTVAKDIEPIAINSELASTIPYLSGESLSEDSLSWLNLQTNRIDKYELLAELGSGGMGIVYTARDTELDRIVALKIMKDISIEEEFRKRFRQEALLLARLQHEHIVRIYDVGEINRRPYLVLEYIDGGSLADAIALGLFPPQEAAKAIKSLASAVQFANQKGIVHRDLKPANVLRTQDGMLKITDFGLAKHLDETALFLTHSKSNVLLGTPSYMAPEQASGKHREVGPHTDVYALGAIFYELLTGHPPFIGSNLMEVLDKVRYEKPKSIREFQPNVPKELATICMKCLMKQTENRFHTAQELESDLERYLQGERIQSKPLKEKNVSVTVQEGTSTIRVAINYLALLLIGIFIGLIVISGLGKNANATFNYVGSEVGKTTGT